MKILSTIRAGKVVRQALYAPRDPNPNPARRRRAVSIPKEERDRANLKTSYEKLLLLMCANFSPGDWWVTFTYADEYLPKTREEALRYWRKFMRQYRRYADDPLRYVYCTQVTTQAGGERLHHHMVLRWENDDERERLKSLWLWGHADVQKLRDLDEIIDKAHYMCREPRELGVKIPGEQMWTSSRGLVRPKPEFTVIDSDAVDIQVPTGCIALADPVQLPDYGGYKTILYYDRSAQ